MRNYPKNRRLPENTLKADLLKRYSLDEIYSIWYHHGMYKGSLKINVSPHVLYYIAKINLWKRPLPKHLQIAMSRGNWTNLITNFKPIK